MRHRAILLVLAVLVAGGTPPTAGALAAGGGGAVAAPGGSGGSGGSSSSRGRAGANDSGGATAGGKYKPRHRMVASVFTLAGTSILAGASMPRITVQITQPDVPKVVAYVQVTPPSGGGRATRVDLGTIRTGRKLTFTLPKARLPSLAAVGTYALRISAVTPQGQILSRTEISPGRASLRVKDKPAAQDPGGSGDPGEGSDDTGIIEPVPGSTKTIADAPFPSSSVRFPVAGAHTFGAGGSRFGVGRVGHTHQGQDVAADTGTPVVAPTAGTITSTGYQASAAGEWVSMHSSDGRDFFFAHCVRRSTAVGEGDAVRAGTHLCDVGSTGDASGPHLHFEIWIDGWRTSSRSHPIDPLPQLKLWQSADPRW